MVLLTKVSVEDARELLAPYGLGSVTAVKPLAGGFANSNVRVSLSGGARAHVLLKVCNEKPEPVLREWVRVLEQLVAAGVKTPRAFVRRLDGKGHVSHMRGIPALVFEFVEDAQSPSVLSVEQMAMVGDQLARANSLQDEQGTLPEYAFGPDAWRTLARELLASASGDVRALAAHPFVRELADHAVPFGERLLEEARALPHGVLHCDVFPDNTMVNKHTGELVIIDWEDVCAGPAVLDLAMTVVGCCYDEAGEHVLEPDTVRFEALLRAYHRRRPLQRAEADCLLDFVVYATYAIAFWYFRQFQVRQRQFVELRERYRLLYDRLPALEPGAPMREALQRVVERIVSGGSLSR